MLPFRVQVLRVFEAAHSGEDYVFPNGSGLATDWQSVRVAAYHAWAEAFLLADTMLAYLGNPNAGYPADADREPPLPVLAGVRRGWPT